MAVQEGVVSDGVKYKHLSFLRAHPHGVINTTDTSDASTTHREELWVERDIHTTLDKSTIQHREPIHSTSTLPPPLMSHPQPPSHTTSVEKLAFPLKLMTHT